VQSRLQGNLRALRHRHRIPRQGLLTGLIFDDLGHRFVPTHTVKGDRRYRYYTSQAVIHGKRAPAVGPTRLPAEELEDLVITQAHMLLRSPQRMREVLDPTAVDGHSINRAVECAAKWNSGLKAQVKTLVPRLVKRVIVRGRSI
jgi:site-specific DNA recombinase